jgi:hypothetical protein
MASRENAPSVAMIVAMETYLPVEDCKYEGRYAERPNYEHMTYVTIPLRRTKS